MKEFFKGAIITLVVAFVFIYSYNDGYNKGYKKGYDRALDTVGSIVKDLATKDSNKVAKIIMPIEKDTLTFYLSNPKYEK
jgi:hypothetical protein